MIETLKQWSDFLLESVNDDFLLYVVPVFSDLHSAVNRPSILFIQNLQKKKTVYYAFDHPDLKSSVPKNKITEGLSNHGGKKWAVDKKSFIHMVPVKGIYDVGFVSYLQDNKVFELSEFETSAHSLIRRNFPKRNNIGKVIPLVKHLEVFSELSEVCKKTIKKFVVDEAFDRFNFSIIEPLSELEKNGLEIDIKEFEKHFYKPPNSRVYTQYYFYTSTGRPSNRFSGVNYAALNKEDGSRKAFISRFGNNGTLVLIDYSTFHPRIISYLTDYTFPKDVDIYEYLAKLYFNKKDIDESDIADSKKITFRQLFGGVEKKYIHIKYLSHLKEFIDSQWNFFNTNGYVESPIFRRKITKKHIQQPKPATVFNYLLQATEGEISIPLLGKVNELLRNKNTKAVLYTYDSILFDYCFDDGSIIKDIKDIMCLDGKFPVKMYYGDNYHEMNLVA